MRSGVCESCGLKPAELVVCVTRADGRGCERRLCGRCARDAERIMFGDSSLLSSELLQASQCEEAGMPGGANAMKVCPECGNTASEVERAGIMGCSTCYEVFRGEIEPIIA